MIKTLWDSHLKWSLFSPGDIPDLHGVSDSASYQHVDRHDGKHVSDRQWNAEWMAQTGTIIIHLNVKTLPLSVMTWEWRKSAKSGHDCEGNLQSNCLFLSWHESEGNPQSNCLFLSWHESDGNLQSNCFFLSTAAHPWVYEPICSFGFSPCRQAVSTSTTLPTPAAQGKSSTVSPLNYHWPALHFYEVQYKGTLILHLLSTAKQGR